MRYSGLSSLFLCACAAAACGGSPHTISASGAGSYESALAASSDRLVAGWYDTRDGNGDIYIRELDEAGRPAGPERRLTTGPEESYEVSLDAAGDALAVAWYDKSADGVLSGRVGAWEIDGRPRWMHDLDAGTRNPVVRARNGRVFCAWIAKSGDAESVWAAWWDASGAVIGAPRLVGPASKTTWNLNAAIDGEDVAWVVYDAAAGTVSDELFMGRIDDVSASLERLTGDDGVSSKYPDIAIDDGRAALAWFDRRDGNPEVYLVADPLSGLSDVDRRATRVTHTAGESIGAYVAWNRGRIGLAWSDDTLGQQEVYFQSFDRQGHPLGDAQRMTQTAASSLIPAIRPWRSGFALAWNEYTGPPNGAHGGHGGGSHIATAVVP